MAQLNDMLATLTPALYAATPAQAPLPPQLAVADVNLGFHVTNCVLSDATKIPTRLVWRPPLLPTAEGIVHAQSDTDASQPMVICQWAGCTGSFPRTSEGLSAHFAEAHPGERIERVDGLHNCRWGACTQFNLKYIRKHLIAHTGCAARACLECGKNYMRVDLRNRHMRVTHGLVVKRSGDVVDLKGSHVGTISPMRLQQTKDRYTPY